MDIEMHNPFEHVAGVVSLAQALQDALTARGCALVAEKRLGTSYAYVRKGDRHSQIMGAVDQRLFSVAFWHRGVSYGHMWHPDLDVIAAGLAKFIEERANLDAMLAVFRVFVATDNGRAHEAGRLVEFQWETLLAHWKEASVRSAPRGGLQADLAALIRLAGRIPALRRLMPFTSHWYLCFSRTTGYPYSADCPMVVPLGRKRFRTYRPGPGYNLLDDLRTLPSNALVAEGSAREALAAVVQYLPPGCEEGAIDGTDDDLLD